jgi:hypothetical protein
MLRINDKRERATVRSILVMVVAAGFCLISFILVPVNAYADWGFRFGDDGWNPAGTTHYNFSKIEFFIPDLPENAGVTWSGNGVSNFSSTDSSNPSLSWNTGTTKVNPTYVLATGNTVNGTLYWDVLFTGDVPKNFRLDYLVYTNDSTPAFALRLKIKDGQLSTNANSGWTPLILSSLSNYDRAPAAVPIPPTLFLMGAGLIGVIVLRKKVNV